MATVTETPELERLFAVGRTRALLRADGRERLVEAGMAGAFLVVAVGDGPAGPVAALARSAEPCSSWSPPM